LQKFALYGRPGGEPDAALYCRDCADEQFGNSSST
jgi:hypothetical protein